MPQKQLYLLSRTFKILKMIIKKQIKEYLLKLLIGNRISLDDAMLLSNNPEEKTKISFSQTGEDMIIDAFAGPNENGFYVDVGAHHPIRYLNTLHFYLKGWKGINIDPIPGIMHEFKRFRPKDINLEMAIGDSGYCDYYIFQDNAFNTLDKIAAEKTIETNLSQLIEVVQISKIPLKSIFDQYIRKDQDIDLLTIDAEGLDLEILKTNNWEKYRPSIICIEHNESLVCSDDINNPDVFLSKHGYIKTGQTLLSAIYKKTN